MHRGDPFAPWNSPLGRESDLCEYGRRHGIDMTRHSDHCARERRRQEEEEQERRDYERQRAELEEQQRWEAEAEWEREEMEREREWDEERLAAGEEPDFGP